MVHWHTVENQLSASLLHADQVRVLQLDAHGGHQLFVIDLDDSPVLYQLPNGLHTIRVTGLKDWPAYQRIPHHVIRVWS